MTIDESGIFFRASQRDSWRPISIAVMNQWYIAYNSHLHASPPEGYLRTSPSTSTSFTTHRCTANHSTSHAASPSPPSRPPSNPTPPRSAPRRTPTRRYAASPPRSRYAPAPARGRRRRRLLRRRRGACGVLELVRLGAGRVVHERGVRGQEGGVDVVNARGAARGQVRGGGIVLRSLEGVWDWCL